MGGGGQRGEISKTKDNRSHATRERETAGGDVQLVARGAGRHASGTQGVADIFRPGEESGPVKRDGGSECSTGERRRSVKRAVGWL